MFVSNVIVIIFLMFVSLAKLKHKGLKFTESLLLSHGLFICYLMFKITLKGGR